jgi:hypothetical protein
MSTKMSARGIVGSLRLVGVTAAVAGIVAVGAAPASAAQGDIPQKACDNMASADVPMAVYLKQGCFDIPVDGQITGGSIFG